MPTLMWIGEDKVTDYHNKVPFPVLTRNGRLSVNSSGTVNILMTGDNPEALKALLPYYNKIKVIYIGPPDNEYSLLSTMSI